jgi:hypothetical protein
VSEARQREEAVVQRGANAATLAPHNLNGTARRSGTHLAQCVRHGRVHERPVPRCPTLTAHLQLKADGQRVARVDVARMPLQRHRIVNVVIVDAQLVASARGSDVALTTTSKEYGV